MPRQANPDDDVVPSPVANGDRRLARRDVLKKLGVGGAIAWSIPTIDAVMSPAAASTAAPFPSGGTALFSDATATAGFYTGLPVNLGVVFVPSAPVSITGVGFYVAAGATGPFTANLWDIGGTLLASAPDTLVADDCWHEVPFASAVAVAAGTAYVASYFSGSGFYPGVDGFFTAPLTVGSVTAPADSDPIAAPGNGRYIYSGVSAFPTLNFNTFNYFVTPVWV